MPSAAPHSSASANTLPLSLPARYVVARHPLVRGAGRTISIGKNRIVLGVQHQLKPGEWVQIAVQWPVVNDNLRTLELETGGEVVESNGTSVAIRIEDCRLRADFASASAEPGS